MRQSTNQYLTWLFVICLLSSISPALAVQDSAPAPVALHEAVGDTLNAGEARRFGLFQELPTLQYALFLPAPWGGYLAHLYLNTDAGPVRRERNVPVDTWQAWQAQVAGIVDGRIPRGTVWTDGLPPPPTEPAPRPVLPVITPGDSSATAPIEPPTRIRVWPEVPLPPFTPRSAFRDSVVAASQFRPLSGHWYLMLEAGYKQDVTDFSEFFPGLGLIGITWGFMVDRIMPFFSMEIGFGDIKDDFEELSGDGRANTYSFSAGALLRQKLSRRTSFYVSGSYGYFIRSLQWGGFFYDPFYNTYTEGYVLEQQDWGYGVRVGVQIIRATQKKPRFLDIGLGLHSSTAEEWHYYDETSNFLASDRDTWVTLSFRIGEGL